MATSVETKTATPPVRVPRPGDEGRLRTPAGRAIATSFLALALGALLGADGLMAVAQRQQLGWRQDWAVAAVEPIQDLSHLTGLDLPRRWLAQLTDREDPPRVESAAPRPTTSTTFDGPPTTSAPGATPTTMAVTTTTLPARRVPTVDAKLKVWMAGDSLMGNLSQAYGRLTRGEARIELRTDVRVSTGLARPDVLDWAGVIEQSLAGYDADVVYLTFGGNDDQPLQTAAGRAELHSQAWKDEYAARVGRVMDVASAGGRRTVVWLGLPSERPDRLNGVRMDINAIVQQQAARRIAVKYVDVGSVVSPNGYSDYVSRPDGSQVLARSPDGVHITHEGSDLVAPFLLEAIAAEWHLV